MHRKRRSRYAGGMLLVVSLLTLTAHCPAQDDNGAAPAKSKAPPPQVMTPAPRGQTQMKVIADGDFEWKLDNVSKGLIHAADKPLLLPLSPGQYKIDATSVDGKGKFTANVTLVRGQQTLVSISATPEAAAGLPAGYMGPKLTPEEQQALADNRKMAMQAQNRLKNDPDLFVRLTPSAMKYPSRQGGAAQQWKLQLISAGAGPHYGVKIEFIMTGVGAKQSSVRLPDLAPGVVPNAYSGMVDQLGTGAVVCYTAKASSHPDPMRVTEVFKIQLSTMGYMQQAAFMAADPPTMEPASDAPCGGIAATKAAPAPAVDSGADAVQPVSLPARQKPGLDGVTLELRAAGLYQAQRYTEARPLFDQACTAGNADACNLLGYMYQNQLGVPTNYLKAVALYTKACNDETAVGCNNLATIYRDGNGVPRDTARAVGLFEKGCNGGIPEGCNALGSMYLDAVGVSRDYTRAQPLFKKGCDAGLAAACGNLGFMYVKGLGTPRDAAYAASLFNKACSGGSRNSCFSMGMMYKGGDGVPRDYARAREFFNKNCTMGDQEGCDQARTLP